MENGADTKQKRLSRTTKWGRWAGERSPSKHMNGDHLEMDLGIQREEKLIFSQYASYVPHVRTTTAMKPKLNITQ